MFPSISVFTSDVTAASNPLEVPSRAIISLICKGERPSGPPDEPGGNERTPFLTAASSNEMVLAGLGLGGSGRLSCGLAGCLLSRAFKVSVVGAANTSSEESSRTAPLKLPSSSLAETALPNCQPSLALFEVGLRPVTFD